MTSPELLAAGPSDSAERSSRISSYVARLPTRVVSIAVVLVASALTIGLLPFWVMVFGVADALTGWRRRRRLRVLGMVTALLINELFGMAMMIFLWVITGFGSAMRSPWSYRLHSWLHARWTRNIMVATERFLGTTVEIRGGDLVEPAPVVVLSRHISLLDAVMPSVLVAWRRGNAPRHVMMRELRFDPCIETLCHRTPNYLVDRGRAGEKALRAIRAVGETLNPRGSGVIFPEGGFRTEARFAKAIESLERRDPELAERGRRLRHVMPPRPGGTLALLQGAPEADVVILNHTGYEGFSTISDIVSNAPIGRPITVELRRIPRAEVPDDEQRFARWLFDQYDRMDAWIDDHQAA